MTAGAFHLPVWFDLGATFAFGLTGALAGAVVFVFLAVMLDVAATPAAGAAIARSRSRSTGGPPRSAGRARKT